MQNKVIQKQMICCISLMCLSNLMIDLRITSMKLGQLLCQSLCYVHLCGLWPLCVDHNLKYRSVKKRTSTGINMSINISIVISIAVGIAGGIAGGIAVGVTGRIAGGIGR